MIVVAQEVENRQLFATEQGRTTSILGIRGACISEREAMLIEVPSEWQMGVATVFHGASQGGRQESRLFAVAPGYRVESQPLEEGGSVEVALRPIPSWGRTAAEVSQLQYLRRTIHAHPDLAEVDPRVRHIIDFILDGRDASADEGQGG